MKRALSLVAVMIVGLAAASAKADFKVGYVDFQQALNSVNEGKKAKAQLKAEFDAKQKQLTDLENQLKTMKDELDKQRLVLSADALKDKEEAFRKKYMELNEKMNTFKNEIATKEQQVTGGIIVRLQKIAQDIGQKDSYNLILEKSQGALVYAPASSDLTERVIQAFNSGQGK